MNPDLTKYRTVTKQLNVLAKNDNILNQANKVDTIHKNNTSKGINLNDSYNRAPSKNLFENFSNLNNKKIIHPYNNYYFKQYKEQYEKHSLNNNLNPHHKIEPGLFGNYSEQLPPDFNPRQTSNMPFNEKVTNWLDSVPIFLVTDKNFEDGTYTPDISINWEEDEVNNYLMGYNNEENFAINSLSTADEIIQFQTKRFDCLSKKLYLRDD